MTPDAKSLRILVTGAAGLIGRELAGSLAARGHGIVALIHRTAALRRNDGQAIPASAWAGAMPLPGAVVTVKGDVRQTGLGLQGIGAPDLVIHCAALTGFDRAAEEYSEINIAGTANVLAFAAAAGCPVLYVSTAYVCGGRDGPIAEGELDMGQTFANGYEASKAQAERLVNAAAAQGQAVAIARPSIVVGASATGTIGSFTNVYALIRLVVEGLIRILPATPGASLDLVPIDHVIGGLTDIAERMEAAAGRTFHLVSGRPVPVEGLRTLALGYSQFHAPVFVTPEAFDPALLTRMERRLNGQVTNLYASYLRRDPRFQDANLRALTGRACPPTDQAFLRRIIDYGVAAGYLKGCRPEAA